MTHYFGAAYDSYDLIKSAENIKNAGGNLIQIFLSLPGDTKTHELSVTRLKEFSKYLKDNNMGVMVHSSYTHNVASNWDEYSWWIKQIELEIKYCHMISALGLVLHFGKQLDLTIEEAYNNMYTSLLYIHMKTIMYKDIKIMLETPTGQGSEICFKLENLSYFFKKFSKNQNREIKDRFRICVDTCHIFAAGYNIKTKKDVKLYLEAFEELIGIRYIGAIHLNDCKVMLGEQKDRHDNIGKGYIGLEGLKAIYNYFRDLKIPIILETPENGYKTEIKLLKNN